MKRIGFRALLVCLLMSGPTMVVAQDCDFTWILISEDGSKPDQKQIQEKQQREAQCKKDLAARQTQAKEARQVLQRDFGVTAEAMTDDEAIARLAR